jgi:magnesium chelatase family protein
MSLALHSAGWHAAGAAPGSAEEAALVPGAQVYRARHLLDVVQQLFAAAPGRPIDGADHDGWARVLQPARGAARTTPTWPT